MSETRFISFFIPASNDTSICDDLNQFFKSHIIIRLTENCINTGARPGIQLLIEYKEDRTINAKNKERIDYRETLASEKEKQIFDKLKDFRTELYKREKMPAAYMVCKDEHLAAIVKNPVITMEEIAQLPNAGNIRLKQFAKVIFEKYQEILSSQTETKSNEENGVPF